MGQRKYDDTYILTSLDFARTLFEKEGRLSRLELRLRPGSNIERVKDELRRTVGAKYQVLDRMEQQADVFNVMKFEKFFAYLFLTFIVLLACFNVVSSLSMVILEKRDDVRTLRHLGMSVSRVRSILSPRAVSLPSSARSPASPSASHSSCSNKNLPHPHGRRQQFHHPHLSCEPPPHRHARYLRHFARRRLFVGLVHRSHIESSVSARLKLSCSPCFFRTNPRPPRETAGFFLPRLQNVPTFVCLIEFNTPLNARHSQHRHHRPRRPR